MTDRRTAAWVRVLCAVALGLGLSGAVTGAALTESTHSSPVVAHVGAALHDATAAAARTPLAIRHLGARHFPPMVGAALLATTVLVGGLVVTGRRRALSTTGGGRRTSSGGARAPPVGIGI
jgi:hypothetical protein